MSWLGPVLAAVATFLKAVWEARHEWSALLAGYGAAQAAAALSDLDQSNKQGMHAAHEAQKDMAAADSALVDGLLDNADRQHRYRQEHKL